MSSLDANKSCTSATPEPNPAETTPSVQPPVSPDQNTQIATSQELHKSTNLIGEALLRVALKIESLEASLLDFRKDVDNRFEALSSKQTELITRSAPSTPDPKSINISVPTKFKGSDSKPKEKGKDEIKSPVSQRASEHNRSRSLSSTRRKQSEAEAKLKGVVESLKNTKPTSDTQLQDQFNLLLTACTEFLDDKPIENTKISLSKKEKDKEPTRPTTIQKRESYVKAYSTSSISQRDQFRHQALFSLQLDQIGSSSFENRKSRNLDALLTSKPLPTPSCLKKQDSVIYTLGTPKKIADILDMSENAATATKNHRRPRASSAGNDQHFVFGLHFLPINNPKKPFAQPICHKFPPVFRVEPETNCWNADSYRLNIIPDEYALRFFGRPHYNWVCSPKNTDEYFLVAIPENPNPKLRIYSALINSKTGLSTLDIPVEKIGAAGDVAAMHKFLHAHFDSTDILRLPRGQLIEEEILKIESDPGLRQVCSGLTIAILGSFKGQTEPMDMLSNSPAKFLPSWNNFLRSLGVPDKAPTTSTWRGFDVTYHVAPNISEEEQRRFIGNTVVLVIFHQASDPFDGSGIEDFGPMTQMIVVVQPYDGLYRIGFIYRTDLAPFGPQLPLDYVFTSVQVQDFILTKVHNCYISTRSHGSLGKMFQLPRAAAINTFVLQNAKRWVKSRKVMHKRVTEGILRKIIST